MYINTKKLRMKLFLIFIIGVLPIMSVAQTTQCPLGYICLTQAEANVARDNALELIATKEKVGILEDALKEKDKSIKEMRTIAEKNENDFKEALKKTEIELATKTGQLIGAESEKVRLTAIIDFMLKNGRKKCQPFSICIN